MARVLIADDESNLRMVLATLLKRDGHQTLTAKDGDDALRQMEDAAVDILLTDLRMPGMTGLELMERAHSFDADLPVIVITAHGTVDTAVSALKSGAFDYITKPFDRDELRLAVKKAASARAAAGVSLRDAGDKAGRRRIIGESSAMRDLYTIIEKVAPTRSTVLVTGESGTGKELVAAAIHDGSDRAGKPLICVNCAAIPADLLESEFFGHEKGAFTGAVSAKPGRFELADGGTLFLDEIAEISTSMQVKLLRALQENAFERVGGIQTIQVDTRVIAATNRDLAKEVEAGNFRDDLFYRLNVVPIALPALRERRDDIPLLVKAFVDRYNERLGKKVRGLTQQALDALAAYPWPGNIRELENVIERTMLFAESETIGHDDLPAELRESLQPSGQPANAMASAALSDNHGASMKDIVKQATEGLERDLIQQALEETGGNITKAATILKISRRGLQTKMKELGLRDTHDKS